MLTKQTFSIVFVCFFDSAYNRIYSKQKKTITYWKVATKYKFIRWHKASIPRRRIWSILEKKSWHLKFLAVETSLLQHVFHTIYCLKWANPSNWSDDRRRTTKCNYIFPTNEKSTIQFISIHRLGSMCNQILINYKFCFCRRCIRFYFKLEIKWV